MKTEIIIILIFALLTMLIIGEVTSDNNSPNYQYNNDIPITEKRTLIVLPESNIADYEVYDSLRYGDTIIYGDDTIIYAY